MLTAAVGVLGQMNATSQHLPVPCFVEGARKKGERTVLPQRQHLQQPRSRILPRDIAKVKHAPQPQILIALEANPRFQLILRRRQFEPHDARVAQRRLVEVIEPVHETHDLWALA